MTCWPTGSSPQHSLPLGRPQDAAHMLTNAMPHEAAPQSQWSPVLPLLSSCLAERPIKRVETKEKF